MKKLLIISFFLLFQITHVSIALNSNKKVNISKDTYVLICVSANAYAYHKDFCRGLNACTHEVRKITISKALELGRKPCGNCY